DRVRWSVLLAGRDNADELRRNVAAILRHQPAGGVEILLADLGSGIETTNTIAELVGAHEQVRAFYFDHDAGEGVGRNVALRQALGEHILWLGNHVEPAGDLWTPLERALAAEGVGAAGGWG